MNDKRRHRRVPVNWPLEVSNRSGGKTRTRILDISESGALFISTQRYEPDDLLALQIVLSASCTIQCVARIIREVPGATRYTVYASEFKQFMPGGHEMLMNALRDVIARVPRHEEQEKRSDDYLPLMATPTTSVPGGKAGQGRDWGVRAEPGAAPVVFVRRS